MCRAGHGQAQLLAELQGCMCRPFLFAAVTGRQSQPIVGRQRQLAACMFVRSCVRFGLPVCSSSSFSCVRFGLSVLVPARVRSFFFWHGLLHRRRQSFQGLSPYEGRAFRGGGFINATAFFPFEVRLIGVWGDTLSVAEVVVLCRTCVRRGCLPKTKYIYIYMYM